MVDDGIFSFMTKRCLVGLLKFNEYCSIFVLFDN